MTNLKGIVLALASTGVLIGFTAAMDYGSNKRFEEGNFELKSKGTCSLYIGDTDKDGVADTSWTRCYEPGTLDLMRLPTQEEIDWYAEH